jgi:tetratricopeptide (TPR) repeat protein
MRKQGSLTEQSPRLTSDPFGRMRRLTDAIKTQTKLGRFGLPAGSREDLPRGERIPSNVGDISGRPTPALLNMAAELYELVETLRKDKETAAKIAGESERDLGHRLDYLRACVWTAEVFAYFGENDRLQALVREEGPVIYGSLLTASKLPLKQRPVARQKVWLAYYYGFWLYRQHKYNEALRVIQACEASLDIIQDEKVFPCYFTRARLLYCRGQVYRQLSELDSAQRCYECAIQLLYKRLEREKEIRSHDKRGQQRAVQEEIRANYEIAKCLALGIGWIQYTRGFLREARTNVLAALAILSPIPDVIHKAYATLLYGCIQRAGAGFDQQELQRAIATLEQPYQKFGVYNHATYRSRAAYELALAYLYRGKAEEMMGESPTESYRKAEAYLDEVQLLSARSSDDRWMCNALTVRSRLERFRKRFDVASTFAHQALNRATSTQQRPQIIEAYIVLGEARVESNDASAEDCERAIQDFQNALEFVDRNPKCYGVCHLHLAHAYLKQKDLIRARDHFEKWEGVKDQVQQQVVQDIGKRVAQELAAASKTRLLVSADETLEFNYHERRVREFLITQATAQHNGNVAKIAKSLGIKRATYYNWLKELRSAGAR